MAKQNVDLELNGEGMDLFWLGGEGFQYIPSWASAYLITTLKVPLENLADLRSVQKIGFWDGEWVSFIRIYDYRTIEELSLVEDFTSLDHHPELVLYEGYIEKGSGRVFLQSSRRP
jgi:hypothetical protein